MEILFWLDEEFWIAFSHRHTLPSRILIGIRTFYRHEQQSYFSLRSSHPYQCNCGQYEIPSGTSFLSFPKHSPPFLHGSSRQSSGISLHHADNHPDSFHTDRSPLHKPLPIYSLSLVFPVFFKTPFTIHLSNKQMQEVDSKNSTSCICHFYLISILQFCI